ncbi:DUF1816 domain-containing protein [Coleofasciculus sp. B1-GNL1-01]|uniref:DUF1816 domain-containing protein n=1 Tax=Coleofasciculus sp. B1-GNL1-01 TaxID=3068484 RepID=UPI0040642EDF
MTGFWKKYQNTFLASLERLGLAWWLKIVTDHPHYTYYFGPFGSGKQAKLYQSGYIEDLQEEGCKISMIELKQGQPKLLTISENEPADNFKSGILDVLYNSKLFS